MTNKEMILSLRKEGKSYNEIKKILNISKSVICYHCKSMNINEPIDRSFYSIKENIDLEELNEYYLTHTILETAEKFGISRSAVIKYVDSKTSKLCEDERKRRKYNHVKNSIQKLKIFGVEYLGGKCSVCGYKTCVDALEFHHVNPSEKEFTISKRPCRALEKLKKELDKCILLCSNCHKELHHNLR